MTTLAPTNKPAPERGQWLAPLLIGSGCLLALFHPTLLSGFQRLQTDVGDTRLNNYVLEHSFRWLGGGFSGSFWDPPIFHPVKNAAGYTDILLGVAPAYWIWRWVGFLPDTSFQLWQMTMVLLDFAVFHWWLRRDFRVRPFPAAVGAALFAIGAPRAAQALHFQLVPQFYSVLAVHGLYLVFQGKVEEARRGWMFVAAGLVLQFYATYYLGWFLFFGLFLAAVWALARPNFRRPVLEAVRRDKWLLVAIGVVCIFVMLPMVVPYLKAARSTRPRLLSPMLMMLPRPLSWFTAAHGSWFYEWTLDLSAFKTIPWRSEHALTLGVGTLAASFVGLAGGWRRPGVQLMVFVSLSIVVLVTLWAPGRTLWQLFWAAFPGARALRSMGRIVLLMLIPAGLGVALLVDRLLDQGRAVVAGLIGLACLIEQLHTTPSFDKLAVRDRLARYASTIPPTCRAFLLTPRLKTDRQPDWLIQVDALWLSMQTGLPTLNGYSGNEPIGWPFHDAAIITPDDEPRLSGALDHWVRTQHLDPATTCWLTPKGDVPPVAAQ